MSIYPTMRVTHSDLGDDFVFAFQDEYTTGEPCWAAVSLRLPGAMGQGDTADEAIVDCRLAMVDLREALSELGIER